MNSKIRKNIFIIAFPLVTFGFILGALLIRDEKMKEDALERGSDVKGVAEIRMEPDVVSVHPSFAVAGEQFEYRMKVVDQDTNLDSLTVRIVEGPDWLFLSEKFVLGGVAVIEDNNVEKVVIEINDGENLVREEFYLLIKENEDALTQ